MKISTAKGILEIVVDHQEIMDSNFFSISGRMAVLIEEAIHRGRTIVHTSIAADNHRFYGTIIWKEERYVTS